jgi:hypothetical protein
LLLVEKSLLVIGFTALGATVGYLLFLIPTALLLPSRNAETAGYGFAALAVLGFVCGAPPGGLVGLLVGWRLIIHERGLGWNRYIWSGIGSGAALGLSITLYELSSTFHNMGWKASLRSPVVCLLLAVVPFASGTLAGIITMFGHTIWSLRSGPKPRRRQRG